ncbi:MOSC:MOSC, N-terminal beta barrel protein, partial [Pseudomonas syringae pv. pisi str. 1704B]
IPGGYQTVNDRVGFADGFPLLLIGQGSLDDLSARMGRPQEMLRFRPNLVIEGAEAFAEDGWKRIRIGDIEFQLLTPCARCILTTVDPATGERSADREPFATLKTYREVEGNVLFGQNVANEGWASLKWGCPSKCWSRGGDCRCPAGVLSAALLPTDHWSSKNRSCQSTRGWGELSFWP